MKRSQFPKIDTYHPCLCQCLCRTTRSNRLFLLFTSIFILFQLIFLTSLHIHFHILLKDSESQQQASLFHFFNNGNQNHGSHYTKKSIGGTINHPIDHLRNKLFQNWHEHEDSNHHSDADHPTSTSQSARFILILTGNNWTIIQHQLVNIFNTTPSTDLFGICLVNLLHPQSSTLQFEQEQQQQDATTIDVQVEAIAKEMAKKLIELKQRHEFIDISKLYSIVPTQGIHKIAWNRYLGARYMWSVYYHQQDYKDDDDDAIKNSTFVGRAVNASVTSSSSHKDHMVTNDDKDGEEPILLFVKDGAMFPHDKNWTMIVQYSLDQPADVNNSHASTSTSEAYLSSNHTTFHHDHDTQEQHQHRHHHHHHHHHHNQHIISFPTRLEKKVMDFAMNSRYEPLQHQDTIPILTNSNNTHNKNHDYYYISPLVDGAITALNLNSFLDFPINDPWLQNEYAANVQLSWNAWLYGGGIHMLSPLRLTVQKYKKQEGQQSSTVSKSNSIMNPIPTTTQDEMDWNNAIRLAHVWMKNYTKQHLVYAHIRKHHNKLPGEFYEMLNQFEWRERKESTWYEVPRNILHSSCYHSFDWYAVSVNTIGMDDMAPSNHLLRPKRQKEDHTLTDTNGSLLSSPPPNNPHPAVRYINQDIISNTESIDLSFVPINHDIAGVKIDEDGKIMARDEDGKDSAQVFDETALQKNPPDFEYDEVEDNCHDMPVEMQTVLKRVSVVDLDAIRQQRELMMNTKMQIKSSTAGHQQYPKLFCMVYTHKADHDQIPSIQQTWGKKCDSFLVASDKTDKALGTVDIGHEGPEKYDNMWQKVRSMWSYVYDHYYEKYDWFYIGGSDVYVLVENLRMYLESDEIQTAANGGFDLPKGNETHQTPLYLGQRMKDEGLYDRIYNTGGPGYLLNKAGLKALVQAIRKCRYKYSQEMSAEDWVVSTCLQKNGIFPFYTLDDYGGERFHHFLPQFYLSRVNDMNVENWYDERKTSDSVEGIGRFSTESIAFHYISSKLKRKMHAVLYGECVLR